MKTFTYKNFKHCTFLVSEYIKSGRMAIEIYDGEGEDVTVCTVNLDKDIPEGTTYIKDYSENQGMLEFLTKLGVVTDVLRYTVTGFVHVPLCAINMDVLKSYSKEV